MGAEGPHSKRVLRRWYLCTVLTLRCCPYASNSILLTHPASPSLCLLQEGIDLKSIQWSQH